MNVLYTNELVNTNYGILPDGFVPYKERGSDNYGMYQSCGLHPDSLTSCLDIYDNQGTHLYDICMKTIVEYGFNYKDIILKIEDRDGNNHWISSFYKKSKIFGFIDVRSIFFNEISEQEAKSYPRLIWIDLISNNPYVLFGQLVDMINRLFVIPIVFIVAAILTIILLYRKYTVEQEKRLKYTTAIIFVLGFPLIMWLIRHLICLLCRLGLWIFTFI